MNTFGRQLRLTTFGESHGPALGGVLDGLPSGLEIDLEAIELALSRRRGGESRLATPRREPDHLRILSGIYEGRTTGTPLAFLVENVDVRSGDYARLADIYRPGHADFTYEAKYGHRDPRGGGRASARETVVRVIAGAIAMQWLTAQGVRIYAYLSRVGGVSLSYEGWTAVELSEQEQACLEGRYRHIVPTLGEETAEKMAREVSEAREAKDSVGGVISCRVYGLPAGLGEPLYDKLTSRLASAMLGINAARGFELGEGFALASMRGSVANDPFHLSVEGRVAQVTNRGGGTLGGIATGAPLTFRVAFKPTSSIGLPQETVRRDLEAVRLEITGRHDPCLALRAVPVVEAMTALTLMDFYLLHARSTQRQGGED
nr:chorismate synthase [uncultured Porphyromonas sp.]